MLSLSPSAHVQDDAATRARDEKNMAVRIDEKVRSREDVQALGIAPGDYVCYDPKTVITESGFVKSRFLDDKASAACLLTLLWRMHHTGERPRYDTSIGFTVHEEVGHGGSTLPPLDELLAVDMGCIGEDPVLHGVSGVHLRQGQQRPLRLRHGQPPGEAGRRQRRGLRRGHLPALRLRCGRRLGGRHGRPRRPDRAGVHASHGMERTHLDALRATLKLAGLYLELE